MSVFCSERQPITLSQYCVVRSVHCVPVHWNVTFMWEHMYWQGKGGLCLSARLLCITCRYVIVLMAMQFNIIHLVSFLVTYWVNSQVPNNNNSNNNYLLTPWCRVLLEKLTGLQLVKKFPVFHGTRRFITALTSVRHSNNNNNNNNNNNLS